MVLSIVAPGASAGVQGPGAAVPLPLAPPLPPIPVVAVPPRVPPIPVVAFTPPVPPIPVVAFTPPVPPIPVVAFTPPVPPIPAAAVAALLPPKPPLPPAPLLEAQAMEETLHPAPASQPALAGGRSPRLERWVHLPEPFAPQDPADSLWRRGRSLLNRSEYRDAAEVFRVIHTDSRYAGSAYRPGSYYYEAFALFRNGSTDELRRARTLLVEMREQYPRDRQIRDADQLEARIIGALARNGDAEAARQLQQQAERGAAQEEGPCPDEDDDTRIVALNALLQMNSDQAVPILREVLARRDECSAALRQRAIFVLSQKRSAGIDQILLEAVRNDPDSEVREAAVFWLSQVNTPEAVTALEEILRTSRDPDVQEKALFALSQNRSDRAQAVLRDYASREDIPMHLRETAIQSLARQRGEENRRFLRELYPRIEDEDLKSHILFSIAQSGDAESLDWLVGIALAENESIEVRKSALFHAATQGALPIPRLVELYDRAGDREFREHVIFALSQRSGDSAAIDKLMDIGRNEPDTELRNRAIFWLSQSRDPRVAEFLLEIINR